jgi:hypothetical protein
MQPGRLAAVILGFLLTLAVLAFVSDGAADPEAFSPAPAPPTVWTVLARAGCPPAVVAVTSTPDVVDAGSRAPPLL